MLIRVRNEKQQKVAFIQNYWSERILSWFDTYNSINSQPLNVKLPFRRVFRRIWTTCLQIANAFEATIVRLPTILAWNFESRNYFHIYFRYPLDCFPPQNPSSGFLKSLYHCSTVFANMFFKQNEIRVIKTELSVEQYTQTYWLSPSL